MTSFSSATLEKKLSDLSNTQHSVQTLSLWLIHHRKHAKAIVQSWYKELTKARTSKKLTFMFLANDVLQNGKRKGTEFLNEFKHVLSAAFQHCAQGGSVEAIRGLERLISIWTERNVYEATFLVKLHKCLGEFLYTVLGKTVFFFALLGEPEDLIKALMELENSASQDAAVREKIANLPAEVQDVSLLEKIEDKETGDRLSKIVDEACLLLADYNGRLAAELEDRTTISKMLAAFIQLQKDKLAESEKKLEEYKAKQEKVQLVRQELKSHLENLPDLTKLPDLAGGLAPLPSAGDLFASGNKS
ncbi:regulation of nuclear pre-mRNA domain-containing protein 1B-like [Pocillopora damicornis]|uniref:regulation of nuclear pre-mRNA domain-containing protein 1B-like n=1 Tax=Pocillopora damicornis TaxID=46731 RepID=UPI000F5507DF|nr:regulation of nuclear pre-mRNA domain-containing protein 1B-like [Pocillopora damicornis]